jgi:hypothetical protein
LTNIKTDIQKGKKGDPEYERGVFKLYYEGLRENIFKINEIAGNMRGEINILSEFSDFIKTLKYSTIVKYYFLDVLIIQGSLFHMCASMNASLDIVKEAIEKDQHERKEKS